jgi:hypothetical protein
MKPWKNNNILTWRDDSRFFQDEFEYAISR